MKRIIRMVWLPMLALAVCSTSCKKNDDSSTGNEQVNYVTSLRVTNGDEETNLFGDN